MSKYEKKDRRDRADRIFVQNQDSMHILMPYLFPKRTDNEAVLGQIIDITAVEEFVAKKNAENPSFKYTFFHVIAAALAKVIILRPKMNYFYSGYRLYERRDIELSFVVKRALDEKSEEALAKIQIDRGGASPLEQVHSAVEKFVTMVRKDKQLEGTAVKMNFLGKLPRFLLKFVFFVLRRLEYHGIYPEVLKNDDPSYASVFITNLGSIGMHADYHHLYEYGTTSFFVIIDKKQPRPFYKEDGTFEIKNSIKLGMTIDERIADGMYFANSLKLLNHLLQHPELLDLDASAPITVE